MKGVLSQRVALKVDALQDRKIHCLQARPCIFQPEIMIFTGWGRERVTQLLQSLEEDAGKRWRLRPSCQSATDMGGWRLCGYLLAKFNSPDECQQQSKVRHVETEMHVETVA